MELPYSLEELRQATHDTLAANEIGSCYVRPIAFRGYGELGVNPLNCPVDVVIAVWPWGAYLGEEALETGVRVTTSSWRRIGPNTVPAAAKASGQYLNSQLAKIEALKAGFDEAILLNEQGFLADGSGENVFVVRDGVLVDAADHVVLPAGHHARHGHAHRARPRLPGASSATSCGPTSTTRTRCSSRAPPRRSRRSARSTTTRSAPGRSRSSIQAGVLRRHVGHARRSRTSTSTSRPWRPRARERGADARRSGSRRPDVGAREEELVLEALRSGTLGLGPFAAPLRERLRGVRRHARTRPRSRAGRPGCTSPCASPGSGRATR